jgi:hypothetical protein
MDHMIVWQIVTARDNRLARLDGRHGPCFVGQSGPSCAVDGTRHTTARLELRVGGINDGLDVILRGNVALDQFERDAVVRNRHGVSYVEFEASDEGFIKV